MKTLKKVIAITVLAGILYGYCYLMGALIEYDYKLNNYTENVIAQETIISTQNVIYACENNIYFVEEEIIEEETIVKNKYTDLINNLTEEEKDLICRITYREAGNQNQEGQIAVIEVILNRVIDPAFPYNVEGVLSQSGQFSTWGGRGSVTEEQINGIYPLFDIIKESETTVLNGNYVYFDGVQHSYGKNYIKIQDHWFAER
jgi:hypothetical protein